MIHQDKKPDKNQHTYRSHLNSFCKYHIDNMQYIQLDNFDSYLNYRHMLRHHSSRDILDRFEICNQQCSLDKNQRQSKYRIYRCKGNIVGLQPIGKSLESIHIWYLIFGNQVCKYYRHWVIQCRLHN